MTTPSSSMHGTTFSTAEPLLEDVSFSDGMMSITLKDGRIIAVPISWFPKLQHAPLEALEIWEPAAAGAGIHWPKIDEDISIEGILRGVAVPASTHSVH